MVLRRISALCVGLLGCAGTPRRPPLAPAALDAAALQGRWHIVATTFPMWTDGRRREPTFTYSHLRREDGRARFEDTVGFVRDGEADTIEGTDTQHAEVPTRFTWRGHGWLALFRSQWDVVALDPEGQWAAIAFSSTIATPDGLDVIARAPTLAPEALSAVLDRLQGDPALRVYLPCMVRLGAQR